MAQIRGSVASVVVAAMSADLQEYRQQFTLIDTADPASLRRWFVQHASFTNYQHAQIAQTNLDQIRKWRDLAGFTRGTQRVSKPHRYRTVHTLTRPPGDWTDPDWLIPAYNRTRSPQAIAQAVGVHRRRVVTALKKLGIHKVTKITHHCNNRDWIQQHYIDQAITLTECAKRAGVNRETFTSWVLKHGFQLRTAAQAQTARLWGNAGEAHIWAQELAHKLDQHPAVKSVKFTDRGLEVKYKYTLMEQYRWDKTHHSLRIFQLDQAGSKYRRDIPIHQQYPGSVFFTGTYAEQNPHPHHLIIKPADWKAATFIEQRIAIHTFMVRARAYYTPVYTYPATVLEQNWRKLRKMNPKVFLHDNILKLSSKGYYYNPVWPIILHHVELRPELAQLWGKYNNIYTAMCTLLTDTSLKICTENLIRMGCQHFGPKIFNPNVYRCLLMAMGQKRGDTVLDLHPGVGLKAVCCAMMGLKYRYIVSARSARWEAAVQRELAQFLELDCAPYTGGVVDLVLADNELYDAGVEPGAVLEQYGALAKRIVCFVKHEHRDELHALYRPDKIIGIKSKLYASQIDCLFIW